MMWQWVARGNIQQIHVSCIPQIKQPLGNGWEGCFFLFMWAVLEVISWRTVVRHM